MRRGLAGRAGGRAGSERSPAHRSRGRPDGLRVCHHRPHRRRWSDVIARHLRRAPRTLYPTIAGPYPAQRIADEPVKAEPAPSRMPHIEAPAIAAAHSPADMPPLPATEPSRPAAIEAPAPVTVISPSADEPPVLTPDPSSSAIEPPVPEPELASPVTEPPAPAAEPVSTVGPSVSETEPPAPAIQPPAAVRASAPTVNPRRHPLRFVWQIDEDERFTINSEEFVALVGPRTTAALGLIWPDLALDLDLDADERVARALATHDTWSGLTVAWPVDDYPGASPWNCPACRYSTVSGCSTATAASASAAISRSSTNWRDCAAPRMRPRRRSRTSRPQRRARPAPKPTPMRRR